MSRPFGFKHSKETKLKQKKTYIQNQMLGKHSLIVKHHTDLNHDNNTDNNILYLSKSNHARFHNLLGHYAIDKLTKKQIIEFTNELLKEHIIRKELSKSWRKLIKLFRLIQFGEVKIKIENGEPVAVSSQAIMTGKGEETKIKLIRKTIDLTK